MIYHVLPGDSLVDEFAKTDLKGEVIVCREAFIVGPLDADESDQFWQERAQFILSDYGEDEIVYHERVADELLRLDEIGRGDEVNLWFEYELFCQVNLWFCMSRLEGSGADLYRVAPAVLSAEDKWSGFGKLNSDDLKVCFAARIKLSKSDVELGAQLWNSYREKDSARLLDLSNTSSRAFPHLEDTAKAASAIESQPLEILSSIREEGTSDRDAIFVEFSKRAGVYGFGDLQVFSLLNKLEEHTSDPEMS